MKEYWITQYGEMEQLQKNCTAALRQALWDCQKEAEPVCLKFPKGVYHFYKEEAAVRRIHTSNTDSVDYPEKSIGILLEELEGFCLDGNGSLFLFHGAMMALALVHCKQVTIRNLSWDFPCASTCELLVLGIQGAVVEYEVPEEQSFEICGQELIWYEESPLSGMRYWQRSGQELACNVLVYEPDGRHCYRSDRELGPLTDYAFLQRTGTRTFSVSYDRKLPPYFQAGTRFAMCPNQFRETTGALIYESSEIRIEQVNVHYMHGFGWLTQMSDTVSFEDCAFVPRTKEGRQTTSFADLIHVSGARGQIRIERCRFKNAQDDAINIHGTFTRVKERLDAHTLILEYVHRQQGGFLQYFPGDRVVFYDRTDLLAFDEERSFTVTKARLLGENAKEMKVSFLEELPEELSAVINGEGRYVAENITYTPSVIIRENDFEAIPTRGILCTTRQPVLIENNIFRELRMAAIFLSNDSADWYESGPIRDMLIRGNTFYLPNQPADKSRTDGILIEPVVLQAEEGWSCENIHRNIVIRDNTFYTDADRVLRMKGVADLVFADNCICSRNGEEKKSAFHFLSNEVLLY